ncbi:hypothetical protein H0H81_006585 [Sphagnurus paluster]|uniref:Uncharacterized protein n=1 Tax=Sphagnurus paluster TaxID=117069 RepID=A0A9P7FRJ8_9AGAR|nr:hypothetical protein H0H81_006585 [Sphagnurus paluster]
MADLASYAAIIDAGSTASRVFIYGWQSDLTLGEPLHIQTAFPLNSAEKKSSEAPGGIQHHHDDMVRYLSPPLQAASSFLQARDVTNVPIFLLATGGMREGVPAKAQALILQAAHGTMPIFSNAFNVGTWDTNTRVIPGSVEGLYGWVALNYGRGVEEQISGLLELGGASMQITYKAPKTQLALERVCLLSGEHRVYSETWDGFGADSTKRRMEAVMLAEAGLGTPIAGSNRTVVGNGDFSTCLRLAKAQLVDGLKTRNAIPAYLDIASFNKHFYGVSNYWYSFRFFAKWGAYDVHRAYDRKAFTDAVKGYCSSAWDDIPWVTEDVDRTSSYIVDRCVYAAWMLTLLHDDEYGFGLEMTQYDTWKGVFRFPTTTDLASRSSWTIGAAALIARHGELRLCPKEETNTLPFQDGRSGPMGMVTTTITVHTTSTVVTTPSLSPMSGVSVNSFTTASMSCIILVLLGLVGYQRRCLSRAYAISMYAPTMRYTDETNV